jgi:hypothetical protein
MERRTRERALRDIGQQAEESEGGDAARGYERPGTPKFLGRAAEI